MSDDPKYRLPDTLNASERAILTAVSRRQRDATPLSLDQEQLLDNWIEGRLPTTEADQAAGLTKTNKPAAEHILERRLIAAANEGPDVPGALSTRILSASRKKPTLWAGLLALRWPAFSAWQWSGLGAVASTIAVIAVFGLQFLQVQLRSNPSFQIAMVTIEDRGALVEGSGYRTRGRRQPNTPDAPSTPQSTEAHFRDLEVPTALLRRAIDSTSVNSQSIAHSELMKSLHDQDQSIDSRALILLDAAIAGSVLKNTPERSSTQVRAYDLDDPSLLPIRKTIPTLSAELPAILLTLRR